MGRTIVSRETEDEILGIGGGGKYLMLMTHEQLLVMGVLLGSVRLGQGIASDIAIEIMDMMETAAGPDILDESYGAHELGATIEDPLTGATIYSSVGKPAVEVTLELS